MNYRSRLKNTRKDWDLTQAEIGKLFHKSQQGYSHIESGRAELKAEVPVAKAVTEEKPKRKRTTKKAAEEAAPAEEAPKKTTRKRTSKKVSE